jgi:uncharacterized protein YndB with AHSA1/START domain
MTKRSAVHYDFSVERTYDAKPERVFAAWSTPEAKARWFKAPDAPIRPADAFDFRVGGHEVVDNNAGDCAGHRFDGWYFEIVTNERIIYAYNLHIGDRLISTSLVTVELKAAKGGTTLKFTEQGAFLDGYEDNGSREHGTNILVDQLGESLKQSAKVA